MIAVPRSGLGLPAGWHQVGNEVIPALVGSSKWTSGTMLPEVPDYMKGLAEGVQAQMPALSLDFASGGDLNPPFIDQIVGLKAGMESASGLSLGQLVDLGYDIGNLVNAEAPSQVAMAIGNLVTDAVDIVVSVAEAANVAADVISVVPILGTFIGGVANLIAGVFRTQEQAKIAAIKCQQRAELHMQQFCGELVRIADVSVTEGTAGPQPGDLFRPLVYAWQNGTPVPPCPAAMYLGLCGGEAQEMSLFGRSSGNDTDPLLGIPRDTQRRMWSLIKGIMAASQDPRPGMPLKASDNGRSLMPVLQDIVRNLYLAGTNPAFSRGKGYGFNNETLQRVADKIGRQYTYHIKCPDLDPGGPGAYAPSEGGSSCASFGEKRKGITPGLVSSFVEGITKFENGLVEVGLLGRDKKTWKKPGSTIGDRLALVSKSEVVLVSSKVPKGVLLIGGKQADDLAQAGAVTDQMIQRQAPSAKVKAAAWTTALMLGGGGAFLARRAAKKRRRR